MSADKPKYYGYLRVSTEGQEVDSQRLGLLEYANRCGLAPVEIVAEKVSRRMDWKARELGALLKKAEKGDVILTPEFTRLAGSPGQVFGFLEEAAKKGVSVHITKTNIVMDGGFQSQVLASVFSMASMIELEFISKRTKEGLLQAKLSGKQIGRPHGSTGFLKLEGKDEEIKKFLSLGLPRNKIALALGVSYPTIKKYISTKKLDKGGAGNDDNRANKRLI